MFTDALLRLSNSQDITTGAIRSTDTIDLGPLTAGNTIRDIGASKTIELVLTVKKAFVGGTSVAITGETDDNTAFSSSVELFSLPTLLTADLIVGKEVRFVLPPADYERYLELLYTVVGTYTAGQFSAHLVIDGASRRQYAVNSEIL